MGRRSQGGSPACSFPPRLSRCLPRTLCLLSRVPSTPSPGLGLGGLGGAGDSWPEQVTDLPCVFGSPWGSLRRKSLRTRQSSEDVYFSKSGEMLCPSMPRPTPPAPQTPQALWGRWGSQAVPRASVGGSGGLGPHVASSSSSWVTPHRDPSPNCDPASPPFQNN